MSQTWHKGTAAPQVATVVDLRERMAANALIRRAEEQLVRLKEQLAREPDCGLERDKELLQRLLQLYRARLKEVRRAEATTNGSDGAPSLLSSMVFPDFEEEVTAAQSPAEDEEPPEGPVSRWPRYYIREPRFVLRI